MAIVLAIVVVGLLAGLAIVVGDSPADALTTTALVVSVISLVSAVVLAFVGYATQSRLSEEMKEGLAEIRVHTADIVDTQKGQIGGIVDRLMARAEIDEEKPRPTRAQPPSSDERAADRAALQTLLEERAPGPLGRQAASEEELLSQLIAHLTKRGIAPEIRAYRDLAWDGPDGREWRAEIKSATAAREQGWFLRALKSAAGQHRLNDFTDEGRTQWVAVLVLPHEPTFEGWDLLADKHQVIVTWPETFESRLDPDEPPPARQDDPGDLPF